MLPLVPIRVISFSPLRWPHKRWRERGSYLITYCYNVYLRMCSDKVGTRNPSMIIELQKLMQRMMWFVKLCRMFFERSTKMVVDKAIKDTIRPTDAPQRVDLKKKDVLFLQIHAWYHRLLTVKVSIGINAWYLRLFMVKASIPRRVITETKSNRYQVMDSNSSSEYWGEKQLRPHSSTTS